MASGFYGKESFRQTREAYDNVGFNLDEEIKPGEERRGIVFFDLKKPATNINSLVIEIKGADKPILSTHQSDHQLKSILDEYNPRSANPVYQLTAGSALLCCRLLALSSRIRVCWHFRWFQ